MQRNKSFRQGQSTSLREVIAQFDLQTAVNRIATRCFNDLLQDHKQAFEYLNDNEKRMGEIQIRMTKMEGFAGSIESKVNSKMQVTKSIGDRLEIFNKQFYQNLKENQNLIKTMRKDYDSVVNATQKNTYDLRHIHDELKQFNNKTTKTDSHIDTEIHKIITKVGQDTMKLQQQIIDQRKHISQMSTALAEARAELKASSASLQETSQDVSLYKHERLSLDRRIKDAVEEITTKASRDEVSQMRLFFDSQMVTEQQKNKQSFSMLNQALKDEIKIRSKEDKQIRQDANIKWNSQHKANSDLTKMIEDLKEDALYRDQKMTNKVNQLSQDMKVQLESIKLKQTDDIASVTKQIQLLKKENERMNERADDFESFQKERYSEIIQLTSSLNGLSDTVNNIIQQNQKRRRDLQRIEIDSEKNNIGDMNSSLNSIREQLIEQRKNVQILSESIDGLSKKQDETVSELNNQYKKMKDTLNQEREETKNNLTQFNRKISSVSIELMKNVQKAEKESKEYTDELRNDLSQRLQMMKQVKKDMDKLKQAFAEQMAQTDRLNRALAEKMQRINAVMTKIKSDLTMRIQSAMNQLQRRSIEIKQQGKLVDDLRKYVSFMNQGLSISLAVSIARQVQEDPNGEAIKISSLLEGWVLETEERQSRYRTEHIPRKRLLWVALNFLSYQGDKVKGTIIDNGKQVFQKMMDETDIFTARKRTFSKRVGSQLPKLHL